MEELHQQLHQSMEMTSKMLGLAHDDVLSAHKEGRQPQFGLIFMALSIARGAIEELSVGAMALCLETDPKMYQCIREYEATLDEAVALQMAIGMMEPSMN